MGTRARFAVWYKRDKVWVVRPPGYPKNFELSFTNQSAMIDWAQGERVMLRDGNPRNAEDGGMKWQASMS